MKRAFRVVLAVELEDGTPPLAGDEQLDRDSPQWRKNKELSEDYMKDWIDGQFTEVIDRTGEPIVITVTDCEETTA